MKAALVVLGILLVVALIVGGKLTSTRNELVQQRESINGAWSQVDVDLQRRADLIPNLVSTVKGFAAQEKEVLNNIANARAGLLNARSPQEKINANAQLDSALGRLLVVVENYPNLKSNENFLRLQDDVWRASPSPDFMRDIGSYELGRRRIAQNALQHRRA